MRDMAESYCAVHPISLDQCSHLFLKDPLSDRVFNCKLGLKGSYMTDPSEYTYQTLKPYARVHLGCTVTPCSDPMLLNPDGQYSSHLGHNVAQIGYVHLDSAHATSTSQSLFDHMFSCTNMIMNSFHSVAHHAPWVHKISQTSLINNTLNLVFVQSFLDAIGRRTPICVLPSWEESVTVQISSCNSVARAIMMFLANYMSFYMINIDMVVNTKLGWHMFAKALNRL